LVSCFCSPLNLLPNAGVQLRRAISIQAEGIRLLEKDAIARQLQGFVGLAVSPIKSAYMRYASTQ
jgi:hypothetical protein